MAVDLLTYGPAIATIGIGLAIDRWRRAIGRSAICRTVHGADGEAGNAGSAKFYRAKAKALREQMD